MSSLANLSLSVGGAQVGTIVGEVVFGSDVSSGSFNWTVPAGVYSISILAVASGSTGSRGGNGSGSKVGLGGNGGAGNPNAAVRAVNNYEVTPGQVFVIRVAAPDPVSSYYDSTGYQNNSSVDGVVNWFTVTVSQSFYANSGQPGFQYSAGYGGSARSGINLNSPEQAPIYLNNEGSATGGGSPKGGVGGVGGWPGGSGGGGGGGAALDGSTGGLGGLGGNGAVRIIWPGHIRSFPSNAV